MGRGGGGGGSHHSSHHSSSHTHHASSYTRHASSSSYHSSGSSYSRRSGGSHYSGGGGGGCSGGCSSMIAVVCFIFFVIAMIWAMFDEEGFNMVDYFQIERSTVNREALPASKCNPTDEWYQDDWGDWIDETGEEAALIEGLKHFYDVTGVQPYLWITGEEGGEYTSAESLEELAESRYREMFGDDEGHVIVVFREYPNASSEYICTITPGYDAEVQIMDEQAREILLDFIDYYYTSAELNEGEFFESAFEKASDRMMTKQLSFMQLNVIIVVALVAVLGIIIVANIIKKRKIAVAKQKTKQAQAAAEQKKAEAAKVQTEFNQQKYQDALEKEYVSVTCPNCGATANKIRKGTVDYCQFCGTAISVDAIGQAFIGDIYHKQQNPPQS